MKSSTDITTGNAMFYSGPARPPLVRCSGSLIIRHFSQEYKNPTADVGSTTGIFGAVG